MRWALAHGNGADGIEVDERGAGDVHVDVFGAQLTGNGSLTALDYDDGFDIDEYDDGSIFGQVVFSTVSDNWEEGLDFNENNAGDLRVNLLLVEANGNREEAHRLRGRRRLRRRRRPRHDDGRHPRQRQRGRRRRRRP